MPYKNPEAKKAWRERYKEKQKVLTKNHHDKNRNSPENRAKRKAKQEEKQEARQIRLDELSTQKQLRISKTVCLAKQCSVCKKIMFKSGNFQRAKASTVGGYRGQCHKCQYTSKENNPNRKWTIRAGFIRQREREAGLPYNLTYKDVKRVWSVFNGKCFNCLSTKKLSFDHHNAMKYGHVASVTNLVLLCRPCNSSKQNKSPKEFYSVDKLKELNLIHLNI
jgi:5-methylcytosine-specific restriction endonuclease McrA